MLQQTNKKKQKKQTATRVMECVCIMYVDGFSNGQKQTKQTVLVTYSLYGKENKKVTE